MGIQDHLMVNVGGSYAREDRAPVPLIGVPKKKYKLHNSSGATFPPAKHISSSTHL